jgi:hypothetical protein
MGILPVRPAELHSAPSQACWVRGLQTFWEHRLQGYVPQQRTCGTDHRFPVKLGILIFSNVTLAGRESAYATALATSSGEIILWRGHFPSM